MTRTTYLALFDNGSKPAHYAIWIPRHNTSELGKLIQVDGNPATGFHLQFVRNYNLIGSTPCDYKLIHLAHVDDKYVADSAGAEQSINTIARDRLESVATSVALPGRSARPFDPLAPNCQNWLHGYVQRLVGEGFVEASVEVVVRDAPRVFPKA